MHVLPLFKGVFTIARKDKEQDQRILRTALTQANKYGFQIADYSNATQLNLATLSKGNDKRLQDTFTRNGIEFKYSPNLPVSQAPKPLTLAQRLGRYFQHGSIGH
jgi:hypothetical protein